MTGVFISVKVWWPGSILRDGATPESTGIKGDHFVGDYYVLFGVELKKQVEAGSGFGTPEGRS